MNAVRNMLMLYIVKLLSPESPAYGNVIPFVKQDSLDELIPHLQIGDIIFTKTNNSWYELCRRLLKTNYDHVSVVISKTEVIHISPPIISKLQISHILVPSREPLIVRLPLQTAQRQSMHAILTSFTGQKYNESAIPTMFKNQIIYRLFQAEKSHQFVFQNMKYSKICTQAILYAVCKGDKKMETQVEKYVCQNTRYKIIGFIMPDQMLGFLNSREGAQIIYKSQADMQSKLLLTKIQQTIETLLDKVGFITDIAVKMSNSPAANVLKQLTKLLKIQSKQHSLIKVVSLIIFAMEIKSGGKLNKYLLVYSILATLMIYRTMPEQMNIDGFKNAFKRLAKL